ncbi:DUF262 domain-containing protein [Fusobacterium sp. THCT13E1]
MFIECDIEIDEKKTIREDDILKTEISFKTQGMDIESILNSLKRGDFILPKYQRLFVWEKEDISKLIMSLIKNIPIPPIYLYFQSDGRYVILDGQQRITSIFLYFNSIFYKDEKNRIRFNFKELSQKLDTLENKNIETRNKTLEKEFNLTSTTYILNNEDATFINMDRSIQRILFRKPLEMVFVQCNSKQRNKIYSDIFKLLNSAGKSLTNQEIRNGVYINNVLYDEIEKINKNQVWRKLFGSNSYNSRDFEYLLRFLSLNYYTEIKNNKLEINYKKLFDYANIIDDFSEIFEIVDKERDKGTKSKNAKKEVKKLIKFFNSICFSNNNENKNKKMSILILEAIFVAYCKLELFNKNIKIDFENFLQNLNTEEFEITRSTSSKVSVLKRMNVALTKMEDEFIK